MKEETFMAAVTEIKNAACNDQVVLANSMSALLKLRILQDIHTELATANELKRIEIHDLICKGEVEEPVV